MTSFRRFACSILPALCLVLFATARMSAAQTRVNETFSGSFTELFQFTTPTGVTGTGRFLVAKFLTDDTTNDLDFRIDPTVGGSTGWPVSDPVSLSGGGESMLDPSGLGPALTLTAVDLNDPLNPSPPDVETGYRIVRIVIQYNQTDANGDDFDFSVSGGGETWGLMVRNLAGTSVEFWGFTHEDVNTTAAAVETAVTLGYVEATDEIDFGEVQVGIKDSDVPKQDLDVQNLGPGPLTLTAMTDLGPPPDGTDSAFDRPGFVEVELDPGKTLSYEIGFDPQHSSVSGALGPLQDTLTIDNDSQNDTTFDATLEATAVQLEIALLVDVSGSMGFRPGDTEYTTPAPDHEETRIYAAKQGGQQLQFLLQELVGEAVRVGLYTFPEQGDISDNPSSHDPVKMKALSLADSALDEAFGDSDDSLQAPKYGETPMAEGLDEAHGVLPTSFASDHWTQGEFVRRALIMLSDGAHTIDSTGSLQTPADWVSYLATITGADQNIRVFTIGYGEEGATWVDKGTLMDLAGDDGGFFDASPSATASISKSFRAALIEWQDFVEISDPEDSLTKGEDAERHTVCIDNSVSHVAFVVDWKKVATNAIDFTLQGPSGTVSASSSDVVSFSTLTSKTFVVNGETLEPGAWKFILSGGAGLSSGESVDYTYSSFGKAKVKLSAAPTGPWTVAQLDDSFLQIKVDDWPFVGDSITLEYDLPGESYSTWLSSMEGIEPGWLVDPGEIPRSDLDVERRDRQDPDNPWIANQIDIGSEASLVERKVYALTNFAKRPYTDTRATGEIELRDDDGDGVFVAEMPAFEFDGVANLRAVLHWSNAFDCIQREIVLDQYLAIQLDPFELVKQIRFLDLVVSPLFPAALQKELEQPVREGYTRQMAVVKPMAGTIPLGPGRLDRVAYEFRDATPVGNVVDLASGEYAQVYEYRVDAAPSVVLNIDGVTTDAIDVATGGVPEPWPWILIIVIALLVLGLLIWLLRLLRR